MSGLEDETDNLLFIFFIDAHTVEIHALVGDLAEGFVVDKHPANEIFVFVDWKALHGERGSSGEWLVMDVSEPGVGNFIIKDKNEAWKIHF